MATPILQSRVESINRRTEQDAEFSTARQTVLQRLAGEGAKFPLVQEVNDRALLGIHPAIPLPAGSDDSLSPELPSYVSRDIDADLHTLLRAKRATGGLIVLVGRAASGKTRCAHEAIKAVLPDWRLCMPGNTESLKALIDSEVDLSHTVIWMDEAQKFLGPGKLEAETVRRLFFNAQHPTIALGTIWPDSYGRLRDQEDPNRDAQEVLRLASRFDLAEFSPTEMERAARIAEIDPRVHEAISSRSDASFTEILAAAPELIHRWNQGDNELGRHIITASIVTRICGHVDIMPTGTLRDVATALMSGTQRARATTEWFEEAVVWACKPVRGVISPLAPYAQEVGTLDGYTVSDVLIQHAVEATALRDKVTNDIWDIVIERSTPEACLSILIEAAKVENFTAAENAAEKAAGGATGFLAVAAMWVTGAVLGQANLDEKALAWWKRAAEESNEDSDEGSDLLSVTSVGMQLLKMERYAEADAWLQRGAVKGHVNSMNGLSISLMAQGKTDDCIHWARRAASSGSVLAMDLLGYVFEEQGAKEEAIAWLRRAAQEGLLRAQARLGVVLIRDSESRAEALAWLQKASESGNTQAMVMLGLSLSSYDSDAEGAEIWLRRAVDQGDVHGIAALGVISAENGDIDAAESWYRKAAIKGHPVAIKELSNILRASDRTDEAAHWEQQINCSPPENNIKQDPSGVVREIPPAD